MLARNAASDANSCAAMFGANRTAVTKKSAAYVELAIAKDTCAKRSAFESIEAYPLQCILLPTVILNNLLHERSAEQYLCSMHTRQGPAWVAEQCR